MNRSGAAKFILFAVFTIGAIALVPLLGLDPETLQAWVLGWGAMAWVAYIALYAFGEAVFIPGTLLTFVGAVAFGFWPGALLAGIGAWVGACLAFSISRALGREFIQRLLGKYLKRMEARNRDRVERLERVIQRNGFLAILLLRFVPFVPFNVMNFAAGFTRIPFWQYASATLIGVMPGTCVYAWLCSALGEKLLAGTLGWADLAQPAVYIPAAIVLVFSAVLVLFRKKLEASMP